MRGYICALKNCSWEGTASSEIYFFIVYDFLEKGNVVQQSRANRYNIRFWKKGSGCLYDIRCPNWSRWSVVTDRWCVFGWTLWSYMQTVNYKLEPCGGEITVESEWSFASILMSPALLRLTVWPLYLRDATQKMGEDNIKCMVWYGIRNSCIP